MLSYQDIRQANLAAAAESLKKRFVDTKKLPGFSLHVAYKGKEIFSSAVGIRNTNMDPWTTNTVHNVASMTKNIVAATLLTLYEEGKLQLDDPVDKYIPEFTNQIYVSGNTLENLETKTVTTKPTLRHLLTHTAGVHSHWFFGAKDSRHLTWDTIGTTIPELAPTGGIPGSNMPELWKVFSKLPLFSEPGKQFRYGGGMDVIGEVICRITGTALDTAVIERILKPCGMQDTAGWHIPEDRMDNVAEMFVPNDDGTGIVRMTEENSAPFHGFTSEVLGVAMREAAGKGGHSGGAFIQSTSSDYFKFVLMLANLGVAPNGNRVLKTETVKLMSQSHCENGATFSDPEFCTHLADEEAGKDFAQNYMSKGTTYGLGCSVVVNKEEVLAADKATNGRGMGPCSVGTFGWLGLFSTEWFVDPAKELTVSFHSQVCFGGVGPYFTSGKNTGVYLQERRSAFANAVYDAMGL
jgi:CubicO group peptidase (beta-lactamase class C family)